MDVRHLKIVLYPNPVLRSKSRAVPQVTTEVRAVARRMLELMHGAPGVGLAANQVGLKVRLFVANPTGVPEDDRVFINPTLQPVGREMEEAEEGCLSIPDVRGKVRRFKTVVIRALDLDGKPFELTGEDLAARVWQHEADHLDGVLIIDRMAPLDRLANRKPLRELELAKD